MRRKHVPQRTCIGCRQAKPKRDLIRVVRTPEGEIVIDETGKRNGRGAYLCADRACWEAALQGEKLGKSLKAAIGERERVMLQEFATEL